MHNRAVACVAGLLLLAVSPAYPAEMTRGRIPQAPPGQWVEYAQALETAGNFQEARRAHDGLAMLLMDQLPPCNWVGAWAQGPYVLRFVGEDSSVATLNPLGFDAIVPASQLSYRKFRTHVASEGPGVAAVAVVLSTPERMSINPLLSAKGMAMAVTVVVELSPAAKKGQRDVVVRIVDSARSSRTLAADYTAPYAWLTHGVGGTGGMALSGLLKPAENVASSGLFAVQPYDPRRIPLVFVHGLDSTPMTWLDVANELGQNTAILRRYQVWVFRYPTGFPIAASATKLRRELEQARRFCDPKGSSPTFDRMVLVGHSMGGLLTRLMVSDSGNLMWNAFFDTPIDQLQMAPDEKALLREVMFFKHRPYIKRVVFMATPHRGSDLAIRPIGRLGSKLVRTPGFLADFGRQITEANPDALRDSIRSTNLGEATSIDSLRPDNPTLKALEYMPIAVPYHSIIGDRGFGMVGQGGDGVVRYWSSHLEGARSELIVPSGHGVHAHPEAIRELDRILRQHLQSAATAPKSRAKSSGKAVRPER